MCALGQRAVIAAYFRKPVGKLFGSAVDILYSVFYLLLLFKRIFDRLFKEFILNLCVIEFKRLYLFFQLVISNAFSQPVGISIFLGLLIGILDDIIIFIIGNEQQPENF